MIVYIIPGKTKKIQEAVDYISDEKKTAKNFDNNRMEYAQYPDLAKHLSYEEYKLTCTDGIRHTLDYIRNEHKIGGYISGYLCHPELAEEQFAQTKIINLNRVGKTLEQDQGNYFYHIIQSFPKGLEISDEEVHNCGLDLVKRLGLYQAVIASHVHPEIEEDGVVHGAQKHNHIIMNSHIYHEFVGEDNPYKMKYHDCNKSYAQLQKINDQIAIEHGLPIISRPEKDHLGSWYEAEEKAKGTSWKERVRIDISNAMRISDGFVSYEQAMIAAGYKLRKGSSKNKGEYLTYTCPDGAKKIRDYKLGPGYTKTELEAYWRIKNEVNYEQYANNSTSQNRIEKILETATEPLFIEFKNRLCDNRKKARRDQNLNIRNYYTNYLPLTPAKNNFHAELTYFQASETYAIVNARYHRIAEVSGHDVLYYFRRIREKEYWEREEEKRRRREKQAQEYYCNLSFIKRAAREPYRVRRYDENGRKRTLIELIAILAIVVIENEQRKWNPTQANDVDGCEAPQNVIYAKTDWKVQRMMDTIRVAREENISSPAELDDRCNMVGKEVSKSAAEVRRLTGAIERTKPLVDAILGYREVMALCDKIHTMPECSEKTALQTEHAREIEIYKKHKATMYRYNVTSDDEIQDVLERYEEYEKKRQYAEEQNTKFCLKYQRLKKLKYDLQLAQNKQFCYGITYDEPEKMLEDKIQAAEAQKENRSNTDKSVPLER